VLRAAPGAASLVRATYDGRPGHPVAIGRDHWELVAASVHGDSGANRYLSTQGAVAVECADLWDGADIDTR
jgi:CTP:molybdopterin cytidylyltransferase MocA